MSVEKLWLEQAESDFRDARLLWENHRYGSAILLYQQSVEKLLKAYISGVTKKVPEKTHRIEVLLKDAKLDSEEIKVESNEVEELSKAYIRVRYPDLNRQYYQKREKAETLVKLSEKLYLWIKEKFKNH